MSRQLWPWATAALVSFVFALFLGLREPADRRMGEVWTQFDVASLQNLTIETPQQTVELLPLGIAMGWVKQKAANRPLEEFLSGARTREVFFALSPLWASRSLGKLSSKKRRDYGFEDAKRILKIRTRDGRVHSFQIGKRGFQASDYFVLDQAKGLVFLWNRDAVDLLLDPARMALRELSFFNPEGLNSLTIHKGNVREPQRALARLAKTWREDGVALAPDDPMFTWLQELSQIPIKAYRLRGKSPMTSLIQMRLETESIWDLHIFYEEASGSHVLDLGPDRPQIILDSVAMRPILKHWNEEKLDIKSSKE